MSETANPAFGKLWAFIASQESSMLSLDPDDRGNWTSGSCGVGQLRGSKFGVSAAAYPGEDIAAMTYERAAAICRAHYWDLLAADRLPAPIAVLLVDAAWGSGLAPAVRTLQASVGAKQDGQLGDLTRAAVARAIAAAPIYALPSGLDVLLAEYAAERVLYESAAGTWEKYKGGWVRRIARSLCLARSLIAVS